MTADEELGAATSNEYQTKPGTLYDKAVAYAFILGLYGIALAVVVYALGYRQYYYHILLAGFLPFALLLGYVFLHVSVLKPRKVGKYVIQNKRLPDDM